MTTLLEWKERLRGFYGKYDAYLLPAFKFLLASAIFWMIRYKIGYMERLNNTALLLILSLACAIFPMSVMLLVAGALTALHCYALAMQAGAIVLVLFVIMFLLYFRLSPGCAHNTLLVPVACALRIPYVLPVANGLVQQPTAVIPTIFGVITYYYLSGIVKNETSLAAATADGEEMAGKFREIIRQFIGNREMYLTIAIFLVTALVVYIIRRLSVDHAWTIAIAIGMILQFLGFFIGYLLLGLSSRMILLCVGCVLSAAILFVLKFFCFSLDYTRTERVQFEDDEYYYYVKAVPKSFVSTKQKTVKKISSAKNRGKAR